MWTMLGRMQEQWNISYRLPAVRNAEGGIIGDAVRGSTVAVAGGNAGTAADATGNEIISECGGAELHLRLGLTAFKHVGVFPEQAPNWDFIHRQVVTWARHNMEISDLGFYLRHFPVCRRIIS